MATAAAIAAAPALGLRCRECGAPLGHYAPGRVRPYVAEGDAVICARRLSCLPDRPANVVPLRRP